MKHLLLALCVAALTFGGPASARAPFPSGYSQDGQGAQTGEADLETHGHYTNRSGDQIHSPAKSKSGAVPAGASARCRDGSYSFSAHRSGTCSRHGGVSQWLH